MYYIKIYLKNIIKNTYYKCNRKIFFKNIFILHHHITIILIFTYYHLLKFLIYLLLFMLLKYYLYISILH